MIRQSTDDKLTNTFNTARAEFDEATKRFAEAIQAIDKVDLFERRTRIVSDCCGAYPYANPKLGSGLCDACGATCGLTAMQF